MEKTFKEAKEAFVRLKVAGKRLKEVFTKATSDKTVIKDETAEEPTEGRPRQRSTETDKVSTNDAKSLKPDLLETSMPPLQIKDWYKK